METKAPTSLQVWLRNKDLQQVSNIRASAFYLGPAIQRPTSRSGSGLRHQGQRPSPDGHQRQGRSLPGPPARVEAGQRQGQLRLQAAQPHLRKVSCLMLFYKPTCFMIASQAAL